MPHQPDVAERSAAEPLFDVFSELLHRFFGDLSPFTPYGQLAAPNPGDQLSFDDFILLTRAAKDFAEAVVAAIAPDEELVISMVDALDASRIGSRLRRDSRLDRGRQLLRNNLEREHGLVQVADSFVDRIASRLIAQR